MKASVKFLAITACAAAFLFTVSCASVPLNLKDHAPAAVATVYANSGVQWYTTGTSSAELPLDDDGILTGAINRALNGENPEQTSTEERINDAAELLLSEMKNRGLAVIDSRNSIEEKNADSDSGFFNSYRPAAGYKLTSTLSRKNTVKFCADAKAQSAFTFCFKFQKQMRRRGSRNESVLARVTLNVYAADLQGNKILKRSYTALSDRGAPVTNTSLYDKKTLVSLFPEATEKAVNLFLDDCLSLEIPENIETETAEASADIEAELPEAL